MSLEGSLKKGLLVFVAITPNQKYLLLFALFPCTSLVPVEGRIAHGGAAVPRAGNIPFAVVRMLQVQTQREEHNATAFAAVRYKMTKFAQEAAVPNWVALFKCWLILVYVVNKAAHLIIKS